MSKTITNDSLGGGPITQNNTINVNVIPPGGSLCPLRGMTGSDAFCVKLDTDPNPGPDRLSILYDGIVEFGNGTNPMDTRIERTAANELTMTGGTVNLKTINTSVSNSTTNIITATNTGAGVNPTYALRSGGQQEFSAGNNPADTFLYRSSANNLTLSTTSLGSPDARLHLGTIYTNSIITNSGDLFISPVGSNINVDSQNINNVNSVLFNAAGFTKIQGTNNGVMLITDNGGVLGTLQAATLQAPLINTSVGDLVLNPAGSNVNFSGKKIINAVLPGSSITFPVNQCLIS